MKMMRVNEINRLAKQLAELLTIKKHKVTCAESCTGGGISFALTDISGSSAWFEQGFVTYSNQAKHDRLNVAWDTLERYGAVSEEVVLSMAKGALAAANAHWAIAVSGIAGPLGGTVAKPVGTVCIAIVSSERYWVETCLFKGDRQDIRHETIRYALMKLIHCLQE